MSSKDSQTDLCNEPIDVKPALRIQDMTVFHLYQAWSAANPIFIRLCEGQFNITRREWRILATIVNYERLPSTELARVAGLDAVRTSRAITSLVDKGWVTRQRDTENGRIMLIAANQEGMDLYARIMPEAVKLNRLLTQDLTAEQLDTLHVALSLVSRRAHLLFESGVVDARSRRGLGAARRTPQ